MPGSNGLVDGPTRDRLRLEFEAARDEILSRRSAEQTRAFFAAKRLRETTSEADAR
jgi:hypothetical protein